MKEKKRNIYLILNFKTKINFVFEKIFTKSEKLSMKSMV